MGRHTLEVRCAELKARMLAARQTNEGMTSSPSPPTQVVKRESIMPGGTRSVAVEPEQKETVRIRNPHLLVSAALSAVRDVPEDYGKLQFRHAGHLDIRVSKTLVRRALAVFDALIKTAERAGLKVALNQRDQTYYRSPRRYTYVTDGREQVKIAVTEKTFQRNNPAWKPESSYSVRRYTYHPSGQLTLILDDESYRWDYSCRRKWRDAKGHRVEEYIDDVLSSIRQTLEARRQERTRSEQERVLRLEREKIRADELRQVREEEQRFEELKGVVDAWSRCERMRAFLAAWERAEETFNGPIQAGTPADGWRRWVSTMVDRLDPLVPVMRHSRSSIEPVDP